MTLKVIGAGLGRTGTSSLRAALGQLLGGSCHHMGIVMRRVGSIPRWHQAILGNPQDYETLLKGFVGVLDWPAVAVWEDLAEAFPESLVLLSVRSSGQEWWESFSQTLLPQVQGAGDCTWSEMCVDAFKRLTPNYADHDAAIAAYEAHNDNVRSTADPKRLIEWTPSDGWRPLCAGLNLPVPDEPFPHINTRKAFRRRTGLSPCPRRTFVRAEG